MDQTNQSKQDRIREAARSRTTTRVILWVIFVVAIVGLMFGMYKLSSREGQVQKNGASQLETSLFFNPAKDRFQGDVAAKTVIIEYADFQCPACRTYAPILAEIQKGLNKDLVLVYRYFPLSMIHPNAKISAYAAEAAQRQGRFWEMHDKLFETQETWSAMGTPNAKKFFIDLAKGLKLDPVKFEADMNSREVAQLVDLSYAAGAQSGVDSTPTLFLNGKKIEAKSVEELKAVINKEVMAAKASK